MTGPDGGAKLPNKDLWAGRTAGHTYTRLKHFTVTRGAHYSEALILFGAGFCIDGPDPASRLSLSALFAQRVSDSVAAGE